MARLFWGVLCVCASYCALLDAQLIFELDVEYSGGTNPTGAPLAVFTDNGDTVTLEMDLSNLTSQEFVTGWYFNFDTELFDIGQLEVSCLSGKEASAIQTGSNLFKAGGDGHYDIQFEFSPSNGKFYGGQNALYSFAMAGGQPLDLADFTFFSFGGADGGYYSAAHVQGIPTNGQSGWVGADAEPIPEPSTYAALGLCLLLAGYNAFRKRSFDSAS